MAVAESFPKAQIAPPPKACGGPPADLASEGSGIFSGLRFLPSWLVSTIVHTAVMLTLALIVLPKENARLHLSLNATPDPVVEELTEVEITQQIFPDEIATDDFSKIPNPGITDFGEPARLPTTELAAVGPVGAQNDVTNIGMLFGDQGQGMSDAGIGTGSAEFFGVKSSGNRFVFVVDGSNSMGRRNKWEKCKEELLAAVEKLDDRHYFYVFLFSRDTHRMFGDDRLMESMVRASPDNISRLRSWLYLYELKNGTVPLGGMKEALEELRPDAIYLLSDGQFTDRRASENYILDFAKAQGDQPDPVTGMYHRTVVNTIAFDSRRGEVVLEGIADAYGGSYRFVPGN